MKAMVLNEYGTNAEFQLTELSQPAVKAGHVVVRVAVQLAKHFGADVYATASGGKQMDIIEKYGATPIDYKADKVADYVAKHTDGAGFDVIFDSVGGTNMTNSFSQYHLPRSGD